jgi:hypothetical protein
MPSASSFDYSALVLSQLPAPELRQLVLNPLK